ncbi:MAG: DUF4249 domain-containing protein [Spirosomaceae bacterium]|nr:DUF4249 domain-containing protein [Spirosomataceae bacterium]
MKKAIVAFCTLLFAAASCVDVFDPKLKSDKQRLVIESRITTEFDYQWVDLTFDAAYNSTTNNFSPVVKNAKIWIIDDKGNRYDFIDDSRKVALAKAPFGFDYRSKDKFKAEVGRTYQLFVETENGKKYRSKLEKVRAVPKLKKIYQEFRYLPQQFGTPIGEFLIFTDVDDSPETNEFYQWDATHWKKLKYCDFVASRGNIDPFIYALECCQDCFEFTICRDCQPITSDQLTNGKIIKRQLLARVPYDSQDPYYLAIRQYSISEEIFTFWQTLKQQAENTGGLFDVNPKSIRGNIECISDPTEEALGYFSVSDVSELITYIDRNLAFPKPYPLYNNRVQQGCVQCVEVANRTRVRPKQMTDK